MSWDWEWWSGDAKQGPKKKKKSEPEPETEPSQDWSADWGHCDQDWGHWDQDWGHWNEDWTAETFEPTDQAPTERSPPKTPKRSKPKKAKTQKGEKTQPVSVPPTGRVSVAPPELETLLKTLPPELVAVLERAGVSPAKSPPVLVSPPAPAAETQSPAAVPSFFTRPGAAAPGKKDAPSTFFGTACANIPSVEKLLVVSPTEAIDKRKRLGYKGFAVSALVDGLIGASTFQMKGSSKLRAGVMLRDASGFMVCTIWMEDFDRVLLLLISLTNKWVHVRYLTRKERPPRKDDPDQESKEFTCSFCKDTQVVQVQVSDSMTSVPTLEQMSVKTWSAARASSSPFVVLRAHVVSSDPILVLKDSDGTKDEVTVFGQHHFLTKIDIHTPHVVTLQPFGGSWKLGESGVIRPVVE